MAGKNLSRRRFITEAAAASMALSLPGVSGSLFGRPEEKPVRLGFVGVGNRGTGLLRHIMAFKGVEIPALCDINEARLARAQKIVEEGLGKRPEGYSCGLPPAV